MNSRPKSLFGLLKSLKTASADQQNAINVGVSVSYEHTFCMRSPTAHERLSEEAIITSLMADKPLAMRRINEPSLLPLMTIPYEIFNRVAEWRQHVS